ncbi:MAG: lytic transglycosylase domain-containing protein [Bdellovibrionaceae bacterium]|nr:lytic transglycosylase domain-containing protein [Pseudobdellovibrionaceae bacterium]MBX3033206.1 lytic transglycosylase domain-containing protein [Pseudobdellovibrionaceae bacterium]
MNTRRNKTTAAILTGFVLCLLFQNGSLVNWDEATLERVDLTIRNTHARELLGVHYKESAARFHEANAELSKVIYQRVKSRLPASHTRQAGAVTRAILSESKTHNFDPVFVLAVIETESQFNPYAIGGVGEIGLMQIRPETGEWISEKLNMPWIGSESLKNPVVNVKIGIAYMAWLRQQMGPNSVRYVAAYNMGPQAVRRLIAQNQKPKEYRSRVLANYEHLYRTLPAAGVATAKL